MRITKENKIIEKTTNMQRKIDIQGENALSQIKEAIKTAAPLAKETISYGIPTFDLKGKHLVHVASYKNHIGFYPNPSAIQAFAKECTPYKTSKGTIQFPLNKPIPLSLIKRIVRFRVKEVTQMQK